MRQIIEVRVGAHLHGTPTAASDTDLRSVHISAARARAHGERDRPGDTDHESRSLERFLDLILEGQPLALKMLFAPDLDLCGRKAAREMASRLLDEYGARTLIAEGDGGVDWRSLPHAVRVGQGTVELLETGRLRFPLFGVGHLLDVKHGRLPADVEAAEIEQLGRPCRMRRRPPACPRSRMPRLPECWCHEPGGSGC